MNEEEARRRLGRAIEQNNSLIDGCDDFVSWYGNVVLLDGHFTADYLEAVVWWMRNKKVERK